MAAVSTSNWQTWALGILMSITLALSGYAWNNTVSRINAVQVQTAANTQFNVKLSAQLWQNSIFQCLKIEKIKAILYNDYDRRLDQAQTYKPNSTIPRSLLQASIRQLEKVKAQLAPETCQIPFPAAQQPPPPQT